MVLDTFSKTMTRIFGSRNERLVKAYRRRVERINATEESVRTLSDAELRARTESFRQRLKEGERIQDLLPEALAVARQVMDRAVGIRSIFNPAQGFDAALLPDAARALYDATAEQMQATAPAAVPVLAARACPCTQARPAGHRPLLAGKTPPRGLASVPWGLWSIERPPE